MKGSALGTLVTLVALTACATAATEPTWHEPRVVPYGWIADYDYKSDLKQYLRHQYDSARLEGATAYMYLFTDSDWHCVRIRQMMRNELLVVAFGETRITMLNYDRIKWLYRQHAQAIFDPGIEAPIFVKISISGDLTEVIAYPELYLFHQGILKGPVTGSPRESERIMIKEFAESMRQFFLANSET